MYYLGQEMNDEREMGSYLVSKTNIMELKYLTDLFSGNDCAGLELLVTLLQLIKMRR